jgi:hypothetical protein
MELALAIDQTGTRARFTRNYRQTANYDYWKTRSEFEQTQDALLAREQLFQAKQAFENGDLIQSRDLYKSGLDHWRQVLDAYPSIIENSIMGSELLDHVKDYRRILDIQGDTLPDDYPLWDIVERYDSGDFSQELATRQTRDAASDAPTEPPAEDSESAGSAGTASGENASAEIPDAPSDGQPPAPGK